MVVRGAGLGLPALLSSSMHMTWLQRIGGRLGNGLRYSKEIMYNTFPAPRASLQVLEDAARGVLKARSRHSGSTLADLYDPDAMPADLRRARWLLDRRVDCLYRREPFMTDMDRLEFLLDRYEAMSKGGAWRRPLPRAPLCGHCKLVAARPAAQGRRPAARAHCVSAVGAPKPAPPALGADGARPGAQTCAHAASRLGRRRVGPRHGGDPLGPADLPDVLGHGARDEPLPRAVAARHHFPDS